MKRLLPLDQDQPLFGSAALRALERDAQAERPAHALMAAAGLACAKLAAALWRPGQMLRILCGPGNNGGDGLIAALHLQALGLPISVHTLADAGRLPPDAAWAWGLAQAQGLPLDTASMTDCTADELLIDALLGLGLSRAPEGALAEAIAAINRSGATVLSVDLPSGLASDTGHAPGACVRAEHTLSLLALKPGLTSAQGRAQCGQLWFDDLGVTGPTTPPDALWIGRDAVRRWQQQHPRRANSHKGSHGDVLIVGGAPGMSGAGLLAASSALHSGAGRVYLCRLDTAAPSPMQPELMHWRASQLQDTGRWAGMTVVAGCGGGTQIAALLPLLMQHAARLVLDADALNAIAAEPQLATQLAQRAQRGQNTLITPHPLEAARLLGCNATQVQSDRAQAASTLAERFGLTVLLKGSGSLIASPGRTLAINSSGSSALATPGSGDVLAGWLGGLWAQSPSGDTHQLAATGCCWHGWASEDHRGPLLAGDLIKAMARLHATAG